jgi:ABC-type transport system substrate-binding protein
MQQWAKLKNVNITPDIQTPTGGQSKGFAGLFEAWYASTPTGRSPDYPESYYALYHSGQTTNLQKVSIPALDKVLDATRDAVTVQQRSDALQKITKVLVDDSVQSLVYRLEQRTYYSSKVKGLKMSDPAFPGTASIWLSSK